MVAPLHVGAVATVLREDRQSIEFADRLVALRECEQLDRLRDVEFVGAQVVGQPGGVLAALHVGPVAAGLHDDQLTVLVVPERERVDLGCVDVVEVLLDEPLQAEQRVIGIATGFGRDGRNVLIVGLSPVETRQPLRFLAIAPGDGVEVLLGRRGEVVVDQRIEVFFEQADDGERGPGRNEGLTLLPHVAAVLHGLNDRRPGRRATDAQFFELLDQRCFAVASRWGGRVADRCDRFGRDEVADGQCREQRLFVGRVVAALFLRCDVDGAIAGECDRRARRGELAVDEFAGRAVGGRSGEAHADGHTGGVGHL